MTMRWLKVQWVAFNRRRFAGRHSVVFADQNDTKSWFGAHSDTSSSK
jgi:hypothetical protein